MGRGGWIAVASGIGAALAVALGRTGTPPPRPADDTGAIRVVPATVERPTFVPANPPIALPPIAEPTTSSAPINLENMTALPARLAGEPRDLAWAPASEARLRTAFAGVPHLTAPLQVACATNLCAIEGRIPVGTPNGAINEAMAIIQGEAMRRAMDGGVFRDNSVRFGADRGQSLRVTGWFVRARP